MDSANSFVRVALALFIPATFLALRALGPRRGVMASMLGGWLFLPVFDGRVDLPLLTTKMTFVSTTILMVSLATDPRRWPRLKLQWIDLAAATLFLGPFATALENGLGAYEGASAMAQAFCAWGAPYLLGRLYFGTPRAVRDFSVMLVGAALLYVPLCLWEIRMSPQLHRIVYGYHVSDYFGFAVRFGGYRPTVFMSTGLMVGTFMATATLAAYWLWRSRAVERIAGVSTVWCALVLAATTILVKSTGALILLGVGIVILESTRLIRRPILILILIIFPVAFCAARISGWTAGELIEASAMVNAERGQSVAFRVANEQILLDKAMQRPALGWGRWGRSRVYEEGGKDVSVTDSLWIILLGTTGLVGLSAMWVVLLVPTALLLRRFPARHWDHPALGPAVALAMGTVLWVVDCLLNSMTSPLFPALAGALITFVQTVGAEGRGRGRTGQEPERTSRGLVRRPAIHRPQSGRT